MGLWGGEEEAESLGIFSILPLIMHAYSHFSCVQLFGTVTHQAPLSMGFSQQEC